MTSQIVLMNKLGLAVASDSSLTMTIGDNRRTYASAEKIFPLGSNHKVAILLSGVTEFMQHPYEVLLIEWNKSLQKSYSTLEEYTESFCSWIAHRQDLFPEESQAEFLEQFLTEYLMKIRSKILKFLRTENILESEWKTEKILDQVNQILDQDIDYLDSLSDLEGINEKWAENRFQSLSSVSQRSIDYVFDDVPRDEASDSKYEIIIKQLLYKKMYSENFDARLAFVGYGDQSIYPKHVWIDFQGVVGDKPRFVKDSSEITPDLRSSLKSHSQAEAIHTFFRAYHPSFSDLAVNYQAESLELIESKLIENLGEEVFQQLQPEFEQIRQERESGLLEEFLMASERDFVEPFVSTLSGLPSTSLGKMAENLIELQILRQTSHAIQDTVGGPVDVAVITLDKGFQWFRHKTLDHLWSSI